jgi:hypothetical protein
MTPLVPPQGALAITAQDDVQAMELEKDGANGLLGVKDCNQHAAWQLDGCVCMALHSR